VIRIYIHREGRIETEAVEVAPETRLTEAVTAEPGAVALLEDAAELLPLDAAITEAGIEDRAHVFTGHREKLLVEVIFNAQTISESFPASTRVEHVFKWATKVIGMSKDDAAEHTLSMCTTGEIPAEDTHIGELDTQGTGTLCFTLIPKHRFEG
jgi:hypothetical protein